MKKQILIIVLALLAISFQQVLAQSPYLEPVELQCIDLEDPLNVVAGHEYTYSVNVPTPPGEKTYHWLVTQDPNFIVDGDFDLTALLIGGPILAGGSVHYDTPSAGEEFNTINLTWQSFRLDPGQFVFVVIYVENEAPDDGCITNNLKVYRISPVHAFTLDIANIDLNTVDSLGVDNLEQCVDDIRSATFDQFWNAGEGGVVYDYGTNTFYYVVAAANFSGSYRLSARFNPVQNPLQVATPDGIIGQVAEIFFHNDFETLVGLTAGGSAFENDNVVTFDVSAPANQAVGAAGQMLYAKIVIDHNSFEAAANGDSYPYTLQIDGVLLDEVGVPLDPDLYGDMVDLPPVPPAPCTIGYIPFVKEITQVITPRPEINNATIGGTYLPIVPAP